MVLLNTQALTTCKEKASGSHISLDCSIQLPNQEDIIKVQNQDLEGCEGSSIISQSTVAMMCDDFSQTNTLDSNDYALQYEEKNLSKEKGVFQRPGIDRGPKNSTRFCEPNNQTFYGYKFKKKSFKAKFRGNGYRHMNTRGRNRSNYPSYIPSIPKEFGYDENKRYSSNLTFENLSKLDLETDTKKDKSDIKDINDNQVNNRDTFIGNSHIADSSQTNFFWKIKQRSESFKEKRHDKTARDREKEQIEVLSNDNYSIGSALSSSDSNRGLVNQKYYRRNVNMCDNQSDMWYGLKTKDGKPVFISSRQAKRKSATKWLYHKNNSINFKNKNEVHNINHERNNWAFNKELFTKKKNHYKLVNRGLKNVSNTWRQGINKPKSHAYNLTQNHINEASIQAPQRMVFYDSQRNTYDNDHSTSFKNTNMVITNEKLKNPSSDNEINQLEISSREKETKTTHLSTENNVSHLNNQLVNLEHFKPDIKNNKVPFSITTSFKRKAKSKGFNKNPNSSTSMKSGLKYSNISKKQLLLKQGVQYKYLPHTQQIFSNDSKSFIQHRPNNSELSKRPLISYDDLESQSNKAQNENSKCYNKQFEKSSNYKKTQKFISNTNRQHVQRLLAETRGLKID